MIEHEVSAPQMTPTTDPSANPSATDLSDRMYPTMPEAESDRTQVEPQPGGEKPESSTPADYAELKAPAGFDDTALGDFKSFAKEQGLSHEQAQRTLGQYGPKIKAITEAPVKAWHDQQAKWEGQVRDYYGSNLDARIETARTVFQVSDANPFIKSGAEATALKRALIQTGAGNHPAVVKMFVKMGQYIEARQTPQDKLLGSMYPNMSE